MTNTTPIETRMKKLEQRKNRLAQTEAMLNTKLRKMRTPRIIKLGGLVSKAKLGDWNANALLGALLIKKLISYKLKLGAIRVIRLLGMRNHSPHHKTNICRFCDMETIY